MKRTSTSPAMAGTLAERLRDAREKYYADIAAIIAANPEKSYGLLMAEHGLTSWAVKRAVKLHHLKRPCGRRSPAYRQRDVGGRQVGTGQ